MLTLNNVTTENTYKDSKTLGPVPSCRQITYLIANQSVYAQLAGQQRSGTQEPWGDEILMPPSTGTFQHLTGIRFRSAVPGSPAQIVAQLVMPEDPVPVGSNAYGGFLSPTGSASPSTVADWNDISGYGTPLLVSSDATVATYVVSVPADLSAILGVGTKIKLTQAGVDSYFVVTARGPFAAGVTPLTLYGGTNYSVAGGAITAIAFSTVRTPLGFDTSPLLWTQRLSNANTNNQGAPAVVTWYNVGGMSLAVPIGIWRLGWQGFITEDSNPGGGGNTDRNLYATLSTGTGTESDKDLTSSLRQLLLEDAISNYFQGVTAQRSKIVAIAAKTTYYLNIARNGTAPSAIGFYGASGHPSIIAAECALL